MRLFLYLMYFWLTNFYKYIKDRKKKKLANKYKKKISALLVIRFFAIYNYCFIYQKVCTQSK